jgi:hypothetical protein
MRVISAVVVLCLGLAISNSEVALPVPEAELQDPMPMELDGPVETDGISLVTEFSDASSDSAAAAGWTMHTLQYCSQNWAMAWKDHTKLSLPECQAKCLADSKCVGITVGDFQGKPTCTKCATSVLSYGSWTTTYLKPGFSEGEAATKATSATAAAIAKQLKAESMKKGKAQAKAKEAKAKALANVAVYAKSSWAAFDELHTKNMKRSRAAQENYMKVMDSSDGYEQKSFQHFRSLNERHNKALENYRQVVQSQQQQRQAAYSRYHLEVEASQKAQFKEEKREKAFRENHYKRVERYRKGIESYHKAAERSSKMEYKRELTEREAKRMLALNRTVQARQAVSAAVQNKERAGKNVMKNNQAAEKDQKALATEYDSYYFYKNKTARALEEEAQQEQEFKNEVAYRQNNIERHAKAVQYAHAQVLKAMQVLKADRSAVTVEEDDLQKSGHTLSAEEGTASRTAGDWRNTKEMNIKKVHQDQANLERAAKVLRSDRVNENITIAQYGRVRAQDQNRVLAIDRRSAMLARMREIHFKNVVRYEDFIKGDNLTLARYKSYLAREQSEYAYYKKKYDANTSLASDEKMYYSRMQYFSSQIAKSKHAVQAAQLEVLDDERALSSEITEYNEYMKKFTSNMSTFREQQAMLSKYRDYHYLAMQKLQQAVFADQAHVKQFETDGNTQYANYTYYSKKFAQTSASNLALRKKYALKMKQYAVGAEKALKAAQNEIAASKKDELEEDSEITAMNETKWRLLQNLRAQQRQELTFKRQQEAHFKQLSIDQRRVESYQKAIKAEKDDEARANSEYAAQKSEYGKNMTAENAQDATYRKTIANDQKQAELDQKALMKAQSSLRADQAYEFKNEQSYRHYKIAKQEAVYKQWRRERVYKYQAEIYQKRIAADKYAVEKSEKALARDKSADAGQEAAYAHDSAAYNSSRAAQRAQWNAMKEYHGTAAKTIVNDKAAVVAAENALRTDERWVYNSTDQFRYARGATLATKYALARRERDFKFQTERHQKRVVQDQQAITHAQDVLRAAVAGDNNQRALVNHYGIDQAASKREAATQQSNFEKYKQVKTGDVERDSKALAKAKASLVADEKFYYAEGETYRQAAANYTETAAAEEKAEEEYKAIVAGYGQKVMSAQSAVERAQKVETRAQQAEWDAQRVYSDAQQQPVPKNMAPGAHQLALANAAKAKAASVAMEKAQKASKKDEAAEYYAQQVYDKYRDEEIWASRHLKNAALDYNVAEKDQESYAPIKWSIYNETYPYVTPYDEVYNGTYVTPYDDIYNETAYPYVSPYNAAARAAFKQQEAQGVDAYPYTYDDKYPYDAGYDYDDYDYPDTYVPYSTADWYPLPKTK